MREPSYLKIARNYLGTKEIVGVINSPVITGWLVKLNAWWRDDEQPWCGVFVAACLDEAKLPYPKLYMRAKTWLSYGAVLDKTCLGCIVIFERAGGGHVGFVVGKDNAGRLLVLGGNQGNEVSIKPFNIDRVLGYRMPLGFATILLPTYTIYLSSSQNES